MRILYDGRIFQKQKTGGINRYFAEIISGLPADYHPLVTGVEDLGKNAPRHPNLEQPHFKLFRPGRISVRLRDRWWKPRLLGGLDLFHPTYYDLTSGYALSDFKCPMVTTVHDLIHARFPLQSDDAAEIIQAQRESVLRADRVVCVSKSTERDLLEFIPEAAGKIDVIYHGSSFPVNGACEATDIHENPSFLYVGGRWGYKNFQLLLRAFAKAASLVPNIRLVLAGYPLAPEERWQMHFLGIADRVTSVVFPEEPALEQLYRKSIALLYPSRYEGFGLPPVEAMACSCPAIVSNQPALLEVCGAAALHCDADDSVELSRLMRIIHDDPVRRAGLIAAGRDRVARFTWRATARILLDVCVQGARIQGHAIAATHAVPQAGESF